MSKIFVNPLFLSSESSSPPPSTASPKRRTPALSPLSSACLYFLPNLLALVKHFAVNLPPLVQQFVWAQFVRQEKCSCRSSLTVTTAASWTLRPHQGPDCSWVCLGALETRSTVALLIFWTVCFLEGLTDLMKWTGCSCWGQAPRWCLDLWVVGLVK